MDSHGTPPLEMQLILLEFAHQPISSQAKLAISKGLWEVGAVIATLMPPRVMEIASLTPITTADLPSRIFTEVALQLREVFNKRFPSLPGPLTI